MKTVTVQIGNSDDKLTQKQWAAFVIEIDRIVKDLDTKIHFFGTPTNYDEWQNAAWVFDCELDHLVSLRHRLKKARSDFGQDSVALTIGETEFV